MRSHVQVLQKWELVQLLRGHADISTTGIYVKADMASRVAAVLGAEAAVS